MEISAALWDAYADNDACSHSSDGWTGDVFCSRVRSDTGLRPRLILQGERVGDEFWLEAPYILAVKIISATLDGSPEPIFEGGPKTLQLVRFVADVENVIKGELSDKRITFLFFVKLDQNPSYYLDPGKRYIVSLRREGKSFRSWADASQLKIEVYSGAHDQTRLPLSLGASATIAYILLTPGTDCDLHVFERGLYWPPHSSLCPEYVYSLLKRLQTHPDPMLSASACIAAAKIFWHQPKCLERALEAPERSLREAAAELLRDDDVDLLGHLQKDPLSLFPSHWTDYIYQMLKIYAEDSRPEVREAACEWLWRLSPEQTAAPCAAAGRFQ